jgi:hypothetical protein
VKEQIDEHLQLIKQALRPFQNLKYKKSLGFFSDSKYDIDRPGGKLGMKKPFEKGSEKCRMCAGEGLCTLF